MIKNSVHIKFFIAIAVLLIAIIQSFTLSAQQYKLRTDSIAAVKNFQSATAALSRTETDSAIHFAEKTLQTAIDNNDISLRAKSLILLGKSYRIAGKHSISLNYFLKAVSMLEKKTDITLLGQVYKEIAFIYRSIAAYKKTNEYLLAAWEIVDNDGTKLEKIDLLEQLANSFILCANYNAATEYYYKLLEIYLQSDNKIKIINTLRQIVDIHLAMGQYNNALQKNYEIYEIYTSLEDYVGMSTTLNNIGYTYVLIADYQAALAAFEESLRIDEKVKASKTSLAKIYNNIGVCYQNLDNAEEAISFFEKALEIFKNTGNKEEIANQYKLMTLTYFYDDDLYNADQYCISTLAAANESNKKEQLRDAYKIYSEILQKGNEPEKALQYYQHYLNLRDSLLVENRIKEQENAELQYKAERTEKEMKLQLADEEMKDLALQQLKLEAEKKAKEMQLLLSEKELQEAELKQQQQAIALEKQQHESQLREQEITTLQKEKEIQSYQLKQKELEEKEREKTIKLLETEKEISKLEDEKREQKEKQMRWVGSLFILIFILVLVSLIFMQRANKKLATQKQVIMEKNVMLEQNTEEILAQKEHLELANKQIQQKNTDLEQKSEEIIAQNEEITQQKQLIEKKNDAIMDSIYYAKRIQDALLPLEQVIADIIPNHFILFQPRDIVSGDFYWIKQLKNKLIVAAADCTGHGVPGAFMSMLGISFLNEIVGEDENITPAEILGQLRELIKSSLRQTGKKNASKEGMDIALVSINTDEKILQYAGAYNPLYLFRDGNLIQYKADRMPIGIYLKEKETFTNNVIEYKSGDSIYLFSDGFIDQFGGPTGDKYKSSRFKTLLEAIQTESLENQLQKLTQELDNWTSHINSTGKEYEQLDDILVIGMKLP